MKSQQYRAVVLAALAVAVVAVVAMRRPSGPDASAQAGIPRLLELGSVSCVPCKMMEPILEELRVEYAGQLQIDFVDVLKETEVAREFDIQIIPTQIFFDAAGKEIYRHVGFLPKEEILAAFQEHGVSLTPPAAAP